jgi:hypothetical protein
VTDAGFQNFQHFIYGLPNGWLFGNNDLADALDIERIRRSIQKDQQLEDELAAMILKGRNVVEGEQSTKIVLPNVKITNHIDKVRLLSIYMLMEEDE